MLMHFETLFKSFNNKNTTTENKRQRTKIPKGRRELENNILVGYVQEDKELKLKCLRTVCHVGDAGHRPLRKITIEH